MSTVHVVKLAFKLQSQLHFFLMVLCVLSILFFELKSHLAFIDSFPFKFFTILLKDFHVLFKNLLIVCLFLELLLVITIEFL